MSNFSASDAALEGFRITWEHKGAFLRWTLFNLVVSVIVAVAAFALGGEHLAALERIATENNPDPEKAMADFQALAPLYAILLPAGILVRSVVGAAVLRAILKPAESRNGYLRFGGDELRLALLSVIYMALLCVLMVGVVLAAGVLVAVVGAAAPALAVPAGLAIGLFALGLVLFVVVRLSLAAPMTFAERRINVFGSWRLTHGQFWRLVGTYALAFCCFAMVLMLVWVILVMTMLLATGGDFSAPGAVLQPDASSLASYFSPATIVSTLIGAVVGVVYIAVLVAPAAIAYRSLSGSAQAEAF